MLSQTDIMNYILIFCTSRSQLRLYYIPCKLAFSLNKPEKAGVGQPKYCIHRLSSCLTHLSSISYSFFKISLKMYAGALTLIDLFMDCDCPAWGQTRQKLQ